jgi:hypothetical protein
MAKSNYRPLDNVKVRPRDKVQVEFILNEVKAHMTETKVQYHMTVLNTSDVI